MHPNTHFLLVDDDPIFLAVAESVVSCLGYERITEVSSGDAGLAALENGSDPVDFIILDLNMPGMDGLAFLRQAAALGFKGQVVISSGETEAVLRSAKLMGEMLDIKVLGTIRKPMNAANLAAVLAQEPVAKKAAPVSVISPAVRLESLELLPHYQSQHDAYDRSIKGLEALIRVRGPDGQIHGPGKLFGLIRNHAELVATTLTIADKVFDDMKRWQAEGILCRVSINLDAKVAEDPTVGPSLVKMVRERNLSPEMVCFELTETALPNDMTQLVEALARLRIAGFGLSLDDFGTGGSNFEVLRLCPFTEIKMDGSVMRSVATEPIARHFLESSVAMARELSLDVVGEGIETEMQLEMARRFGVGLIQGYLLSVPVSAEDMRRPLSQSMRLSA